MLTYYPTIHSGDKMINNQKQFDTMLKERLELIIEYLQIQIEDCIKDHIWTDVYSYDYFPNVKYEDASRHPSFQFLDAFVFEDIKILAKEVSTEMIYDWESMQSPSASHPYTHGNYFEGIDRRKSLASLLNVKGIDSGNDWGGKERNAFWDEAIKEINQKFDKWAKEACNKYLR